MGAEEGQQSLIWREWTRQASQTEVTSALVHLVCQSNHVCNRDRRLRAGKVHSLAVIRNLIARRYLT